MEAVTPMASSTSKQKSAHLDYDTRTEKRLVYDRSTGEFREPHPYFIQTIPVDRISSIHGLPKSAVLTWLACWFLHGCNKGQRFTLNSSTARRFGLNTQNRRRGLRALEEAGLVIIHRQRGRLSLIELI